MYVIKNNAIVKVDYKSIIATGKVVDARIQVIENVVATYYEVPVNELDNWYTTKYLHAKIMCCFMLHNVLKYSLLSLAVKYNIDRFYLRNQITSCYQKALVNAFFVNELTDLQDAYLKSNPLASNKVLTECLSS